MRRRIAGPAALMAIVIAGFLVARAVPSFAPRSISADDADIRLALDGTTGLPSVDVSVNGGGPYPFIADTGAAVTVITAELARELGLMQGLTVNAGRPGGGTMPGRLVHIDRIDVGGTRLEAVDAVVLDLSSLWSGAGAPRGVLSLATLHSVLVTLDLPSRTLRFTAGELREADEITTFGWADGPVPTMTVDVGGRRILAAVDTGSTFGITLPDRYADEVALVARPTAGARTRGVGGTVATRTGVLAGAGRIGARTIDAPEISFADVPRANLGFGILREFTLVIDAANRRIRVLG